MEVKVVQGGHVERVRSLRELSDLVSCTRSEAVVRFWPIPFSFTPFVLSKSRLQLLYLNTLPFRSFPSSQHRGFSLSFRRHNQPTGSYVYFPFLVKFLPMLTPARLPPQSATSPGDSEPHAQPRQEAPAALRAKPTLRTPWVSTPLCPSLPARPFVSTITFRRFREGTNFHLFSSSRPL